MGCDVQLVWIRSRNVQECGEISKELSRVGVREKKNYRGKVLGDFRQKCRGTCKSVVIIVVNSVVLIENLNSNGPTTLQEWVSFKTRDARRDVHEKLNVETERFKTEPSLNETERFKTESSLNETERFKTEPSLNKTERFKTESSLNETERFKTESSLNAAVCDRTNQQLYQKTRQLYEMSLTTALENLQRVQTFACWYQRLSNIGRISVVDFSTVLELVTVSKDWGGPRAGERQGTRASSTYQQKGNWPKQTIGTARSELAFFRRGCDVMYVDLKTAAGSVYSLNLFCYNLLGTYNGTKKQ